MLGLAWRERSPEERAAFLRELEDLERSGASPPPAVADPGPVTGSLAQPIQASAYAPTLRGRERGGAPVRDPEAAPPSRYSVRKEAARGGMGRILLALDTTVGREVALKELLPERGGGSEWDRERFLREARITGQLEHPNIVPVYEIGSGEDGAPYYTMKFVRGETLEARIRKVQEDARLAPRQRLSERLKLLDAFVDACHAVAYAHSRGIVNRDLKPANVMIGDFGETVVLDWGLARVRGQEDVTALELRNASRVAPPEPPAPGDRGRTGDTTRLTLQGDVVGTPAYMPPEQARGEIDVVDERSDVYALGAVLYEILTGRAPFEGASLEEILRSVIHQEPEAVERVEPLAPRELAAVARAAMTKDRGRRLDSANRLADEVRAWRDGRPMSLYRHSPWEQIRRFARHNRALSAAIGAAALILVAGAAVSLALAQKERRARAEADRMTSLERDARAAEQRALSETKAALRAAEGQRLAAVAMPLVEKNPSAALVLAIEAAKLAPGRESGNAIWASLDRLTERRRFVGEDYSIPALAMSPDGKLIASGGSEFTVRLWDAATGRPLKRMDGHVCAVGQVQFSADGRSLLSVPIHPGDERVSNVLPPGAFDCVPRLWSVPDGACLAALRGHTAPLRGAEILKDGRVFSWAEDDTARFWRDGRTESLVTLPPRARSLAVSQDGRWLAASYGPQGVRLWDVPSGAAPRTILRDGSVYGNVAFTASGRLVAGEDGGSVSLFVPATLEEAARAEIAGGEPVWGVAAHPLSPRLAFTASSGQERTKLWFWDEDLKGPSRCVDWHGSFWPGQLSPDWSRGVWQLGVAAAVRNLLTDQTEASCTGHEYTIDRAVFTPDGRILTGSRDHDIALWDPVAGLCLPTFAWGVGRNILALSPDGARVAVRGEDGRIELRDNATGSLVARGPTVPARAPAVGFLPDYRRLWIRAADPWELHLWDPAGGETRRLASPGEEFSLIAITPDASAAFISLARGCGQVLRFDGGPSSTSDLPIAAHTHAFSPDGTLYALVHASAGRVDLHDAGGRRLISLAPHNGSAMHAAFLPGGRVVTTAMDASLRLWDASSGALQRIGRWPRISDTYVSPSPDGRWIAAWAGSEGRVYRTDTMEEAVTVPASTVVHGMSFTADSRWVAVFSPDRVRHFPLEPLPFAETVRPRDLKPLEFQRLLAKTPDEAAAYSKAYRARHPNVLAQLTLAERALEDGKAEEAARVAAETIAILPGHPTARRVLAEARALQAAALPEASDARRRMADAAMEELAKAVECGLRQVDRLRASQGFQAVAADARWEGLMAREKEVGK